MKALVLIVEDDEAIRDSLKLLLEARGYGCATFRSGAELFQFEHRASGGCLILDVNLPGDTGFQVLARLRQEGISTPAIFVSGRPTLTTREQAAQAKAIAYFDKPVPIADLLAALANATGHKS